jgi:protein AATF/BFR2
VKLGKKPLASVWGHSDYGYRKSKLRKPGQVALGPEYAGSRISREALVNGEDEDELELTNEEEVDDAEEDDTAPFADPEDVDMDVDEEDEDIDSEAAFGESDVEKFKDFTFRGSGKHRVPNETKKRPVAADFMSDGEDDGVALNGDRTEDDETDEDVLQHAEESDDESKRSGQSIGDEDDGNRSDEKSTGSEVAESEDGSGTDSEDEDDEKARRAELRKIMNEEQKTVMATISQAAKSDADKGNAVKKQRAAFGSLVSARMVMQKALIATNSMSAAEEKEEEDAAAHPYQAAEEAAVKLWNTLDGIRYQLSKASTTAKAGQKRKLDINTSTTLSAIWERMQASEIAAIDIRQSSLEKWSAKVRGATAMPVSQKFNPTAAQQSITSVLQDHLVSSDHLVNRTKIPRSCAPVQRDLKITEDPNIYDDANFYQLVLKEFVDQKRMDALATPGLGDDSANLVQFKATKEVKSRKNVDTKASKGRKLRYTVHEKLQNFMAPEDRGSWEQDAVDRFFGTLLGQKMTLREDEVEDDPEQNEEEGLVLFRS